MADSRSCTPRAGGGVCPAAARSRCSWRVNGACAISGICRDSRSTQLSPGQTLITPGAVSGRTASLGQSRRGADDFARSSRVPTRDGSCGPNRARCARSVADAAHTSATIAPLWSQICECGAARQRAELMLPAQDPSAPGAAEIPQFRHPATVTRLVIMRPQDTSSAWESAPKIHTCGRRAPLSARSSSHIMTALLSLTQYARRGALDRTSFPSRNGLQQRGSGGTHVNASIACGVRPFHPHWRSRVCVTVSVHRQQRTVCLA